MNNVDMCNGMKSRVKVLEFIDFFEILERDSSYNFVSIFKKEITNKPNRKFISLHKVVVQEPHSKPQIHYTVLYEEFYEEK